MKLLLDTNILVDVLSRRKPFFEDSAECCAKAIKRGDELCVSASCVTDLVYILRKHIADREEMLSKVQNFLDIVTILDTSGVAVRGAFKIMKSDFEDAVLLQCAVEGGVDAIVTRNAKDFPSSQIKIVSPADFLKLLR